MTELISPIRALAVFDLDGVLVQGETQKHFAWFLLQRGEINWWLFGRIFFWFIIYKMGLIKDTLPMRRTVYRVFSGWSIEKMRDLADKLFEIELRRRLFLGGLDLVNSHRNAGHEVILLSASLEPLVKRVAEHFGLSYYIATRLETANGYYTGRYFGEVPHGETKAKALKHFLDGKPLYKKIYVYADHVSDLSLLEQATEPTVVNPDVRLRALALKKGWSLRDIH